MSRWKLRFPPDRIPEFADRYPDRDKDESIVHIELRAQSCRMSARGLPHCVQVEDTGQPVPMPTEHSQGSR